MMGRETRLTGRAFAALASALVGGFMTLNTALAVEIDLPVTNGVVYPGQPVTSRGLSDRAFIVKDEKLGLFIADTALLEGQVAKRRLLPGRAIRVSDIETPDAVKAGGPVTLLFKAGSLEITGLGTALQSAKEGEIIKVRNADTGIVVTGVVSEAGLVRIEG